MKMEKLKRFVTSGTTLVSANIVLLLYEVFFTLSVWELIPGLGTHFGGGLGDLMFGFAMVLLLIFHTISLLICGMVNAKKVAYAVLLWVYFVPLLGLHAMALKGNFKDYSSFGNAHGLYYDRLKKK